MRILLLIGFVICSSWTLWAQTAADSAMHLGGVEIFGDRIQYGQNAAIQHYASKELESRSSESLSQVLKDYAGVNIKTYGYGGMSNIAMRGSNSNHTAVLWNGVNLQDPLNGGVNLSLFPVYLLDEIQVQKGGNSALFGSGAMGGSLHLNSKLQFGKGWQGDVYSSLGSFGAYQVGSSARYSNQKFASVVKLYYKESQNDFKYTNTKQFGQPEQRQANAAQKQYGFLQENEILITQNQRISTSLWAQQSQQQLPASMQQRQSLQHQEEESVRGQIEWSLFGRMYKLKIRSASLYSTLTYHNPSIDLVAFHQSFIQITEAEFSRKFREKDNLQLGINHSIEIGKSDQLLQNSERNRAAVFVAYQSFLGKKMKITGSLRKEYVGERFTPLTYSAGIQWFDLGIFSFQAQLTKNYRVPTFNDLYWNDGMSKGNPGLNDESSLGQEFSIAMAKNKTLKSWNANISLFNTHYNNLIQWVSASSIWSPVNQQEVWARGLDAHLDYQIQFKKWNIATRANYVLTFSTIQQQGETNTEDIIGKQLILTPQHEANGSIRIKYHNYHVEYLQEFVGQRYTTADNSEFLDPYTIGNIIIGYQTTLWKHKTQIRFRWNNLWNTQYESIPAYAMPLNNFEINLRIYFNQSKS